MNETILLVDDDEAVRRYLGRVLRAAGYSVLDAGGLDDAGLIAARHPAPIHALITDMELQHRTGAELARLVGGTRPGLRVLFISGDPARAAEACADDAPARFVPKPIAAGDLLAALRGLLDEPPR